MTVPSFRLLPRRASTRVVLVLAGVALATGVSLRVASMRRQQLDYWRGALAGGAVTTRATVDDWYLERVADAEGLAEGVALYARSDGWADTSRLARFVTPVGRERRGVAVRIVDADARPIAGPRTDSTYDAERAMVREVVRTQRTLHSELILDPTRGTYLALAAPIRGADRRPGHAAAVLLRADVVKAFAPWATGRPNSALSVMVAGGRNGIMLLRVCPEGAQPLCVNTLSGVPMGGVAELALAGRDTFGLFHAMDGSTMLAATRFDSLLGWGIVRRIPEDAAFAQFRRQASIEGMFLLAILALVAVGGVALDRNARIRRLHERSQADARLATVVDASIDGLVSLDESFRVTMINAAVERQFGHDRDWLLGRPVLELFAPEVQAHLAARLEAFAASGTAQGALADAEHSIGRRRDGSYFPVDATLGRATIRGATLYTMGVHDISERVRAEAFAKGQREVLEMIAAGAPVRDTVSALILVMEVEAPRLRCAVYGLDEDGVVLTLLSAPSLSADLATVVDEVIVGPTSDAVGTAVYRGEPVVSADIATDPLWAESRDYVLSYGVRACWAMPLRGADGMPVGALACFGDAARGPTARELELASTVGHLASIALSSARDAAAMRASEASFRSFVENAPAAIFRETLSGHLVSTNAAMVALLGYSDGESLARAAAAGRLYHDPAARARLLGALEADDVARGVEADWRRADGTRVTVRLSARAYRDDRGHVWLWEGYAEDVTPLRMAEGALRRNEKLAAVGQLVSGVAHELNNPLSSILHFAEDLLSDPRTADDAEALGVIRDQARRSRAIVRDLLSFVQQRDVQTEPVALERTVAATVRAMQPKAASYGARLHLDAQQDAVVHVDRTALEQVITNLVSNAIQAAGLGGDVWVRTACGVDWCQLVVEDSGPGIAPDILPRIFDPFFTTKPTGEGTGLGLSVTLGIVEQFGGRITTEPRAGGARGSRFVVTLPVQGGERAGAPPRPRVLPAPTPAPAPPERAAGAPASRRVLLIDDETTIRAALRRFFTRRGWEVEEAEDGARALATLAVNDERFDLVVSDLRMPGFSGVELHDRLAMERPALLRRMVFSTGDVASPEAASFVQRTSCPVLQKPFELRALDDLIASLAERGVLHRVVA